MADNFRMILGFKGFSQTGKPLGFNKCKIKVAKERQRIFFRRKFTGTLQFVDADYRFLNAIEQSAERCEQVTIEIQKACNGVFQPNWWQGYFSMNDVRFNHSKGTATVVPTSDDAYRPVLDNYGKPFNILEVSAKVPVATSLDLEASFEFTYTEHGQTPDEAPESWALFAELNFWAKGDIFSQGYRNNQSIHFRLVRTENMISGEAPDLSFDGWMILSEDFVAGVAKYGKKPDLYNFKPYDWNSVGNFGKYPELIQLPCGEAYDDLKYINVTAGFMQGGTPEGCIDLRERSFTQRNVQILWQFGSFSFTRNRRLMDVLNHLVETTTKSKNLLPVKSDFFSLDLNYATGQANKLKDLLIAQKSDIIGFSSSEAARLGELSLKNLLDGLRQLFDCYWFINTEGKFQVEHAAYFEPEESFELTEAKDPDFLKQTNAYEYEKAEMPRFQKLKFTESSNPDFQEGGIEYGGLCVNYEEGADTEEELVSIFNNDVEQLLVSGEALSKTGFVLLAHQNGEIIKEHGHYTGRLLVNGPLAASNLIRDYHTYNRILGNGTVNDKENTIFKSVRKTKKQISLRFYICCAEPYPYSRFITDVSGNGSLQEMEINLSDGVATFVILHETSGSGTVTFSRQFDDSFDLSFN